MINNILCEKILGRKIDKDFEFDNLGLINTTIKNSLVFLDEEKYINQLVKNENISGVIVGTWLIEKLPSKLISILSDDPRWDFYSLYNYIAKENYKQRPSMISKSAKIHQKAFISDLNVEIGDNTQIGPNVTILSDVKIGSECIIQAGTVIGSEGFEYKRTAKGILSVFHDGEVIIKDRVEIGANTSIDKGFANRSTNIEEDVKIDNLCHIAHGVHIKRGAFIIAGTILGGSTTIGENAWISINGSIAPGLSLGKNSFVSIGSTVTRNVEEHQQVTGNFAIPHNLFLKLLKKNIEELESK